MRRVDVGVDRRPLYDRRWDRFENRLWGRLWDRRWDRFENRLWDQLGVPVEDDL